MLLRPSQEQRQSASHGEIVAFLRVEGGDAGPARTSATVDRRANWECARDDVKYSATATGTTVAKLVGDAEARLPGTVKQRHDSFSG